MPVFSCFTALGFLNFSSEPSECEKVYNALVAGYRDPRTGTMTIDCSVGTHQEAKIFGWANAIAAARVTLRGAANELRAETAYCLLEYQEEKFGMSPADGDSVPTRRVALAAKQKFARGPRFEAVWNALLAIFDTNLVAYRPIAVAEAEAYPVDPGHASSPGLFVRPDAVAESVRLLTAVTRLADPLAIADEYSDANRDGETPLDDTTTMAGQSFVGNGSVLSRATLSLARDGLTTGPMYAEIYAASATSGSSAVPTGARLAVSDAVDASTLAGAFALHNFDFYGENQIELASGTSYVLVLRWENGTAGVLMVLWGRDDSATAHSGNASTYAAGVWTATALFDHCFRLYTGPKATVYYENWDKSLLEVKLRKGDVLAVDSGILGVAERVIVLESSGSGTERTFSAAFRRPHTAETHATTGPVPIWTNTKRHVLVVVKSAAAVDVTMLDKVNELFRRVMRAGTTWAVVEPTTPGAVTVGPFKVGTTLGSPLGAVPLESITL